MALHCGCLTKPEMTLLFAYLLDLAHSCQCVDRASKGYCTSSIHINLISFRDALWLLWELQMHPDPVALIDCSHLWIGGELSDPHDL